MSNTGAWIRELENRKLESTWSNLWGNLSAKLQPNRSPFDSLPQLARRSGRPMWGSLIKVNGTLLKPNPTCKGSFGLIVAAPDLDHSTAYDTLPALVQAIHSLCDQRASMVNDAATCDFIDRVDDDRVGEFQVWTVPSFLTPGYSAIMMTAIIDRRALPEGFLRSRTLPVCYAHQWAYVSPVTHTFWDKHYLSDWLKSDYSLAEHGDSDFCAFEINGLPPEALDSLEQVILGLCSDRRLKCLFLNTGAYHQPGEAPAPTSGDLCYLGHGKDLDSIVTLLGDALEEVITDDQGQSVAIVELEIDDFVERYGAIMDMADD